MKNIFAELKLRLLQTDIDSEYSGSTISIYSKYSVGFNYRKSDLLCEFRR